MFSLWRLNGVGTALRRCHLLRNATCMSAHDRQPSADQRQGQGQKRTLAAFDFDLTIIAQDSDTAVSQLLVRELANAKLLALIKQCGWIAFIQEVLRLLQEKQQLDASQIGDKVRRIPAVPGMLRLLRKLSQQPRVDMYIISDSNCFFIDEWLAAHGLETLFAGIYSNPTTIESNGQLQVWPYETQTHCVHCPRNLCKGSVLQQLGGPSVYQRIIYVGDSCNDLCAMMQLQPHDIACIRRGHELDAKLKAHRRDIKASVLLWSDGHDLYEQLFALL